MAENIETGEKTDIGVFGVLMQMGILEQVEKNEKISEELSKLNERVQSIETKVLNIQKSINKIFAKTDEEEERSTKKEMKEHVLEKAIEKVEKEEKESEKPSPDIKVESEEEIKNWMEI